MVAVLKGASPNVFRFADAEDLDYLAKAFDEILEPIYCGHKQRFLEMILNGNDRFCEILYEEDEKVGLLVYKNFLTDEVVPEAFEIKSLFLTSPDKNSGRGLGTKLLYQAAMRAVEMNAKKMFVSVNSTKLDSLIFFLKNSFVIRQSKQSLYLPSTYEYFLVHDNPKLLKEQLFFK